MRRNGGVHAVAALCVALFVEHARRARRVVFLGGVVFVVYDGQHLWGIAAVVVAAAVVFP